MKRFKGQGKLTKLIASRVAMLNRNHFSTLIYDAQQLNEITKRVVNNQNIALKLVSFSSSNDYPEQVLSILSFLRHVGKPLSWTIYSDGSHTHQEIATLEEALPFVQIICRDTFETHFTIDNLKLALHPYRQELHHFATKHVLGKKLFLFLNRAVDEPTLFLDSDILFYEKSSMLRTLFVSATQGWFLSEGWGCLDRRYVASKEPEHYQVNAGFFLMNSELSNVRHGLRFLKNIEHTYEYFTEQTILHILLTSNKYRRLDPELFIVNTCDQFDFSYAYGRDEIAMRHYTGPVRHKMWQRNWKWQLSLT